MTPLPSLRGFVGLRADRQRVLSDVRPVPLLRHQPDGDRELLRQPVHLQRWWAPLSPPAPPPPTHTHTYPQSSPFLSAVILTCGLYPPPSAAPGRSSGILQGVLLTLSMCLLLLALLLLMMWLRRTGQDGRRRQTKEEEEEGEECYNEIRYTPSLMKRSFV